MKAFKNLIFSVIGLFFSVIAVLFIIKKIKPETYSEINNARIIWQYNARYSIMNPFNKPSSENSLILDFSDNDLSYNDSILKIITSTEKYIPDEIKEWKKTNLIFKKNRYKVKYRFHGGHNGSYKKGKISLKIKSKEYINGAKQFNLITTLYESSFINIFIALQGQKLKLISPDTGSILLANINGETEDFWFTEDLSSNYLYDNFGFDNYHIFKVNDNWLMNGNGHISELDGFYYYLDSDNLEEDSENFSKYKSFVESINNIGKTDILSKIDYKYMGRFLAHLYYFYSIHHVSGDNNKFLYDYTKDLVYPVARNEGSFRKIINVLNFDQGIFDLTYKSSTHDFYKKSVCNDSVRFYRDLELYKLVRNKNKILNELDSLHRKYNDYHKYFSSEYYRIKQSHESMKDIITHNSNFLRKYLNNGEVAIAFNKKNQTMKVVTDYKVPLKIINTETSESFILKGFVFGYKDSKIKTELIENKFNLKKAIKKSQLRIINLVTNDTIPSNNIIFNYF